MCKYKAVEARKGSKREENNELKRVKLCVLSSCLESKNKKKDILYNRKINVRGMEIQCGDGKI